MKQILVIALLILSKNLFACRCDLPLEFSKKDIDQADYIALVKIKKILPLQDHAFLNNPYRYNYFKIVIREKRNYKTHKFKEIIVMGGHPKFNTWTSCDYDMNENEEWIVFGKHERGKVVVNSCSRSARFIQYPATNDYRSQNALEKIKFLDNFFDKKN